MSIATIFNAHYQQACPTGHPAYGYIRVPTAQCVISCDFEVLATLKALLKTGVTPNEILANTCRDFFLKILHSDTKHITKQSAMESLSVSLATESQELYQEISNILGG